MRPRLLAALAAGASTVALLGPTDAHAVDPSGPAPSPATAHARAAAVLTEAQAVFETGPAQRTGAAQRRDATLVLNQLMRVRDSLSPSEQREADRFFARPTEGNGDTINGVTFKYDNDEETPLCGDIICIHYASPPDADAPPQDDTDTDGVPDVVQTALDVAEHVNDTYLDAGYRRPDSDGSRGGGTGKVDIYLANTGAAHLYGYCTVDRNSSGSHRPAYCVIDDDFDDFPSHTPLQNMQVTLAHEYFHAVQFAYDYWEDFWISEATATWAEDEVYDGVNDNRQYLPASQLELPTSPLDRFTSGFSYQYGNWIFVRYLTERFPGRTGTMPTLVRQLWERMSSRPADPDLYSTQAIQSVLAQRGTSFTPAYAEFATVNRKPASFYEEGSAYDPAPPSRTWTLSRASRRTGETSRKLDHLTSLPLRFRPGSSLDQRDWRLKLRVDMPPKGTAPVARVARYLSNGDVRYSPIPLQRRGFSTTSVGFSSRNVDRVELVLVNASRRTRACGSATNFDASYWACFGHPRDNNLRTTFTATAFRR